MELNLKQTIDSMFLFQELNKNEWNEDWAAMAEAFTVRLDRNLEKVKTQVMRSLWICYNHLQTVDLLPSGHIFDNFHQFGGRMLKTMESKHSKPEKHLMEPMTDFPKGILCGSFACYWTHGFIGFNVRYGSCSWNILLWPGTTDTYQFCVLPGAASILLNCTNWPQSRRSYTAATYKSDFGKGKKSTNYKPAVCCEQLGKYFPLFGDKEEANGGFGRLKSGLRLHFTNQFTIYGNTKYKPIYYLCCPSQWLDLIRLTLGDSCSIRT